LKFDKDKRRWIHWLFEAKKRFGLMILNFTVTSNHIHLLVYDGKVDIIPKSIQLIAGRTGREYNQRKNRKGAFWEDRYHATAVKTGKHLIRCLAYIDLNMVRAGVVQHPGEWVYGGYQEIQNPRQRYTLINRQKLTALLGIKDNDQLPFGIGEVLGGFSIIMFWIQISAAKIILQNFPPSVFQFIQGSSGSGLLPGLIIGNFINIFLLIVFSFILSVIYSLAKVGDRRVSDKLGNS
jgi:REP element-mobilizing transposase RayT